MSKDEPRGMNSEASEKKSGASGTFQRWQKKISGASGTFQRWQKKFPEPLEQPEI
jgi:hypothetical protein